MKSKLKASLKRYRNRIYKLRISPEIEVEFSEKQDVELLYSRYNKLLSSWHVVTDGSLDHGLEFKPRSKNHLHFDKESFDEISEVIHIIKKHHGQIKKTCGGHWHIDASHFTDKEILKIVKELVARQKYLVEDFKVRKERLNFTCCPIKKKDIKGLTEKHIHNLRLPHRDYYDGSDNIPILRDKYYILNLLNLSTYNSLEFRLFEGTLSIREMKKTIKYIFEFLINALERN